MKPSVALVPRPVPTGEAELIQGCKQGSREAQAELYRTWRPHVMRILYRVLGPNGDGVEDVVQEVFMAAFHAIVKFRGDSRLSTWLYRVSVNVALQWLARRRRSREVSAGADGDVPVVADDRTPQRAAESRERMRAVYRILDEMSDKRRVVFVLSEIEQMEPREIAAIIGVPVVTVRTRLHYARREFFERAARSDFGPPA